MIKKDFKFKTILIYSAEQVIIVRDQKTKKKLKETIKSRALVMTILEVILVVFAISVLLRLFVNAFYYFFLLVSYLYIDFFM